MTGRSITTLCAIVLAVVLPFNSVFAADRGVFNGKSLFQHELTDWEKKKMEAEFRNKFSASKSGSYQKLARNPWEAKKAKKQQHNRKMLKLSNTWGNCREFAYKQRGQCYARGGDAYTCERYYDARSNHCDNKF
jgi:Skp family chaperone for outer membrane proteins